MSRLEQLIEELCPDGAEFKELGEVVEILDYLRRPISKDKREIGTYPYYGANGILEYVKDYIFDGTFLLFGEDGSVINKDGSPILNWATGKIWVNNHAHVLSENKEVALLRYLYYYLSTIDVTSIVRGVPPKINQQSLRTISIPIPPLPIQQEIVTILDTFTALDASLQAELEARRKQYEHYRNQLMNFEEKEVEWKTLGEIGKVCMCKRVMKHETKSTGDIPFYKIGTFGKEADAYISQELFEEYISKFSFPKKGDILISASGTIGRRVIYDAKPAYFQDSNIVWLSNNEKEILNKYLYYVYETIEWPVEGGTIKRLYNDNFMKIKIPIPPLSEQERIVGILDKFEALVSGELPAEIAARRKQYEYYREKLLDFEPITN